MPPLKSTTPVPATVRPTESAFRQLVHTIGLVERVMQPYFAQFGISGSQWAVMRTLHRAEHEGVPGLRLTDLGERLLIRPPSVTGVVDRLERAGLVVRDGSPTDLRAKHVALTARGRELVERMLSFHGRQIDTLLGGLNPNEQHELHRLLTRLEHHLEGLLSGRGAANIG